MSIYERKQASPPMVQELEHQPCQGSSQDDAYLARMGKRPVLKHLSIAWQRNFSLVSMIGFCCTILVTWEAIPVLFIQSFQNGGLAGSVYSYIIVWIGVTATFVVISELVSMAPTSGGQYHWCSMLAPPSAMKLLSYITGESIRWLGAIGWQATFAACIYLSGTLLEGLIILTNPGYTPMPWRRTLYSFVTALFDGSINIVGGKLLPRFEAQHRTAAEVFTVFLNEGHWPTQGLSVLVGMIGPVFAFAGGDAAVHIVEEMTNAATAVPIALMTSTFMNGALGFGILLALCFCIGNIQEVLEAPAGMHFIAIFHHATGSVAGTTAAATIIYVMTICCSVGAHASASRQLWAFARDRGVPGWRIWREVNPETAIPTNTVILTVAVACSLNLINIGSDVAFNSLCSMASSGLYLSYMVATGLLLYRRCTDGIAEPHSGEQTMINTAGAKLVWGPFRIRGICGILINAFSLAYMTIATFFSFWPPINNVTVETMNYSVVGTFGVVILSLFYYGVRAKNVYSGPVIEI
ncbi:amino acid/polyamine transporter I [Aspergillus avenaceus]|uniref:Amino acid/polyamine transporter I n=1 Tax=Aspergillus avenaceus TaxID=36643 RepID=A0A5N6U3Q2_ASPAV|nr:amino acid/polyamine transporter I [Aspergillus avenaceus]